MIFEQRHQGRKKVDEHTWQVCAWQGEIKVKA